MGAPTEAQQDTSPSSMTEVVAAKYRNQRTGLGMETMDAESQLEDAVSTSLVKHEFCRDNPHVIETRELLKVTPLALPHHLTAHTLAGPARISVSPHVFIDDTRGSLLAFYHLGLDLSGHTGLVHGGFLAVLLDECMGRSCFALLPGKIGVTVRLELEYKKPVKSNSIVVVRGVTERVEGRKAWVKGVVGSVGQDDGEVLVEANGLFIQPRWAAEMDQIL